MHLSYEELKVLLSNLDEAHAKSPDYLIEILNNINELLISTIRKKLDSSKNPLVEEGLANFKESFKEIYEKIKITPPEKAMEEIHRAFNQLEASIKENETPALRSQIWYLARMQAVGYEITPEGMCYGLSHMAMQAFLANDMQTFDDRLQAIYEIPIDDCKDDFANLRKKQQAFIAEGKTNEAHAVNNNIVNMLAFFDGITLYNNTGKHQDLFDHTVKPQDAEEAMPIVLPLALDNEEKNPATIGTTPQKAYKQKELMYELLRIQNTLGEHSFSMQLSLFTPGTGFKSFRGESAMGHAINLNYNSETKQWLLIDPNILPGIEYSNTDALAEAIMSASPQYDDKKGLEIGMIFYTTAEHANKMALNFNRRYNTPDQNFFADCDARGREAVNKADLASLEQEITRVQKHFGSDSRMVYNINFNLIEEAINSEQIHIIKHLIHNIPELHKHCVGSLPRVLPTVSPKFQQDLLLLLNTEPHVLYKDTRSLDDALYFFPRASHPALINALHKNITSLIPDFSSAKPILKTLSEAGKDELIQSHGEHLCSIILDPKVTPAQRRSLGREFIKKLESWHSKQEQIKIKDALVQLKSPKEDTPDEAPSVTPKNQ